MSSRVLASVTPVSVPKSAAKAGRQPLSQVATENTPADKRVGKRTSSSGYTNFMGDQLQQYQTAQKWYAKPQVLAPAAAIGYLLLNKKTRKKTLLYGGGIIFAYGAYTYFSGDDGMTKGFGTLFMTTGGGVLALGYFSKSK